MRKSFLHQVKKFRRSPANPRPSQWRGIQNVTSWPSLVMTNTRDIVTSEAVSRCSAFQASPDLGVTSWGHGTRTWYWTVNWTLSDTYGSQRSKVKVRPQTTMWGQGCIHDVSVRWMISIVSCTHTASPLLDWIGVQNLRPAIAKIVLQCRMIMKWSDAFSAYAAGESRYSLFKIFSMNEVKVLCIR